MNLFIIGNGFDLAHGLPTTYQDFRNYLLEENPEISIDSFVRPEGRMLPDGGISYNDDEVLSMLIFLIDQAEKGFEEWNDIETALGHLDFSEAFDVEHLDKEGDLDYWAMVAVNEDIADDLIIPTSTIQVAFSDWINTITTYFAEQKKDFLKLIERGDQFINFNYTDTLEALYNINQDQVLHIHGRQNEEIYFGHGDSNNYSEDYLSSNIGSQEALSKIDEQLRKKTEIALESNIDFFNNLVDLNIKRIYSFGFSFNDVDKIYLEKIISLVETDNITWYFNDYDGPYIENFKKTLFSCGYKGTFGTFSIIE